MLNQFSRTELILGSDAMEKLRKSRVAVFGIGGVGGYTVEALVRSGIGAIDLIDSDKISITNINRQIYALLDTVGEYKVDVARERIKRINPECEVRTHKIFYTPENSGELDFNNYDYIVDAIDTISGKIEIAVRGQECGVPVISSMGAGNKLDPTVFKVADIYETKVCPLAKVMRYELRKRGIKKLKTVYSEEAPIIPDTDSYEETGKKRIPGSNAFVPSVCGLIIAGEVIKDLIK